MLNVDDVELDRSYEDPFDPPEIPPSRMGWVIGAVVVLAIAAGVGYYIFFTQPREAPAKPTPKTVTVPPAVTEPVAPPEAPAIAPENIALPPLPQTDTIVRDLLGKLSSHPSVAAWLATKGLITNFTVVTLNVAEGQAPTTHLRALTPRGRFQTTQAGASLTVDPRSYARYNGYAEAISQLDATGAARVYLTLKPRIADAYRELGSDGDFDRVLERAIGQLLRVPVVEGRTALRPKTLSFAYADPRLESLTPAQKQFLRMGPDNVQIVQAKLREIAALLALHPEPVH